MDGADAAPKHWRFPLLRHLGTFGESLRRRRLDRETQGYPNMKEQAQTLPRTGPLEDAALDKEDLERRVKESKRPRPPSCGGPFVGG